MSHAGFRFTSLRNLYFIIVCMMLTAITSSAQTPTPSRPKSSVPNRAPSAAAAASPMFKAIWEPMNYPDDLVFQDVYFANDKVGWVSGKGEGGFIFHTADGGANWDVQVGDPHSNNAEINYLRFLDATHGWAVQGSQLIRTTDGKTWQTIGPFVPNFPLAQYRFLSVQDGFEVGGYYSGSTIFSTHDGGRSWKPVFACGTTLQVNGLTQKTSCFLRDMFFASMKVGYAVGGGFNDAWAVIAKTVDGGATWKVIFASTDVDTASAVFFTDENNGVVRLRDHRVLITADGGQTWSGATGAAEATLKFADPQVGWSCIVQGNPSCSYTVDGGKSWTTRTIGFPEDIQSYSMPRRDLIYAVGPHGMIYRYHVVPADYMAKGMLDAPLMPTYGGPIVPQLQQMQTQVTALQAQISAAAASGSPASGASAGGGSAQNISTQSSAGAPLGNQAATASGGFSQDASAASGTPQDPNATAGGFVQDTSTAPTSQFVQSCCASQVQDLQTSFNTVAQQVPNFSGQFRNLNLLFVGLNMLSDMMNRAKQMRDSMVALKKAPDAQTALAALSALLTNVQSTSQAITTQFSNLSAAPASGSPGGVIGNQVAGAPAVPDSSATPGAAPAAAPAASGQPTSSNTAGSQAGSQASSTAGTAAGSVVNKLKKKLPF